MSPAPGVIAVGIGLLIVLLEVPGFGVDFANDILGFTLVAWAAWRLRPEIGWSTVAVLAGAAAAVSVFGYGGPASRIVVFGDRTWILLVVAEMIVRSAVFGAVLWALTGSGAVSRRTRGLLVAATVALTVATLGWALAVATAGGVAGASGALAQACAVVVGLLQGLTILLIFTFSPKR